MVSDNARTDGGTTLKTIMATIDSIVACTVGDSAPNRARVDGDDSFFGGGV
jgi:hypothetical protein